jgi:F-type H+-transporting ATPase subunit a
MTMRNGFCALGLVILLAALLALSTSRARATAAEEHKEATDAKAAKGSEHHEEGHKPPSAMEEVGDQDEEWTFFHEFDIAIPMGWIEIGGYRVPTKYMILALIAAGLILWIFISVAKVVQTGEPVSGAFLNLFEGMLTFIRDEVAKPNFPEHAHGPEHGHGEGHSEAHHKEESHEHPADEFVPLLWTIFFFVLFCNVLGMVPFMGSPTANIYFNLGLALICFLVFHGAPIAKMGFFQYFYALWPKIDVGIPVLGLIIKLMIFVIELIGTVIKSGVLAIRLFANMFAGHMVLASIMLFIVVARGSDLWGLVLGASLLGNISLSLLELFVAFLQAYIFAFLTALFLGMGLNPEH